MSRPGLWAEWESVEQSGLGGHSEPQCPLREVQVASVSWLSEGPLQGWLMLSLSHSTATHRPCLLVKQFAGHSGSPEAPGLRLKLVEGEGRAGQGLESGSFQNAP